MSTPAVTVIMPAFNAGRYVDEAVASILAQTYRDFELLAFDDASEDDTLSRLQAWSRRDPRVIAQSGPHRGIAGLRNEGIRQARGKWIALMDADDVAYPNRFARQIAWLESHPGVVALGGGFEVIDEDGDPVQIHLPATEHAALVNGLLSGYGSQLCDPAVFMLRSAVERVGGYRAQFDNAIDVDLFIRLSEIGQLGAIAEPLIHYRWHLRSVSHTRRGQQQAAVNAILTEAWQRRGEPMPEAVQRRLSDLAERTPPSSTTRELQERIIWLARHHGNLRTARKHAARLLRQRWWERRSWRMWLECWRKVAPPTTN